MRGEMEMNEQNKEQIEKILNLLKQQGTVTITARKGMDGQDRILYDWFSLLGKNRIVNCEEKRDEETLRPVMYMYKLFDDWENKLKHYYTRLEQEELRKNLDIKNYEESKKANQLADESNKIARRANCISWWAFGISIVGTVAAILIAIFV